MIGLAVNPDIIIDGKHVASLWPKPETHAPAIAYQHCEQWEQDEKWRVRYEEHYHLGLTIDEYRDDKAVLAALRKAGRL